MICLRQTVVKKLLEFKKQWGEETEALQSQLERVKEKIWEKVSNTKGIGDASGAISISRALTDMSPEQRSRVLHKAGYSEKEAIEICKKLAASALLTGGEVVVFGAAAISAASIYGINPIFTEFNDTAKAAVLLSYAAKYASAVWNGKKSVELLKEESIGNCPNVFSTGTFYLLKDKGKIKEWGAIGASLVEPVCQELLWTSTFVSPAIGASVITAKNISGAVIHLAEAVGKGIYLKAKKNTSNK